MRSCYMASFTVALVLLNLSSARAQDDSITVEPSAPWATDSQKEAYHERLEQEAADRDEDEQAAARERDEEISAEGSYEAPDYGDSYDGLPDGDTILGVVVLAGLAMLAIPAIAAWLSDEPEPAASNVGSTTPNDLPSEPERAREQREDAPADERATSVVNEPATAASLLGPQASYASQDEAREAQVAQAIRVVAALLAMLVVGLLLAVLTTWRLFAKSGRPGWHALLPIVSWCLFLELGGVAGWLVFVPFVNLVVTAFVVPFGIASRFGKSRWFALGLLLFGAIFYPLLAFGRSTYSAMPRSAGGYATS